MSALDRAILAYHDKAGPQAEMEARAELTALRSQLAAQEARIVALEAAARRAVNLYAMGDFSELKARQNAALDALAAELA